MKLRENIVPFSHQLLLPIFQNLRKHYECYIENNEKHFEHVFYSER